MILNKVQSPTIYCQKKTTLNKKKKTTNKLKIWFKIVYHTNTNQKIAQLFILMSDKVDFKEKNNTRDRVLIVIKKHDVIKKT